MLEQKYKALLLYLKSLEKLTIAFSGGVDSTFLAYAAKEALGDNALTITVDSPYIPRWELDEAKELSKSIGIKQEIIHLTEIPQAIEFNPDNRCYLCKSHIQ